jgi:glyoxylase-like metal-dependent hydrolase (beta-lactamase superfamily II)
VNVLPLACSILTNIHPWNEQVGIGQRAILIQTPAGNILWDLIAYLDQPTVDKIQSLGGLSAIVISHPHYYTTWSDWSRTFQCPVFVARADDEWLECVSTSPGADLRFLERETEEVVEGSGAVAIVAGGHFPGSLLLCWDGVLFVADTVIMAPSALNPTPGREGVISFGFVSAVLFLLLCPSAVVADLKTVLVDSQSHSATSR